MLIGGGGTRTPPGGWCARRVNVFGCLRWQRPFLRSIVLSQHLCQLQQPGPHLGRLATSCDERSNDQLTWAEIKIINTTINTINTTTTEERRRPDWSTTGLPFGSLLRVLDPASSTSSPSTSEPFLLRQPLDWCDQISSWNDANVSVRLTRHIRRMMSTQTGNGRLSKSSSEGPIFSSRFPCHRMPWITIAQVYHTFIHLYIYICAVSTYIGLHVYTYR